MGGEPLLHPQATEFFPIVRELFPNSEIQIVTNGILLNSEIKAACNEYLIKVCVSNYGLNFDLNERLSGLNFTRVDGKANLYNIALDLTGSQDTNTAFNNCDLHMYKWYYFNFGRFYPCCIGANIH